MKNNLLRKSVSVLLCVALLLGCGGLVGYAADVSWEQYWDDYVSDGSALYMSPGSSETSRGFSWFSPADSGKCFVEISPNSDMMDSLIFYGKSVITPQKDKRNRVTVTGLSLNAEYYYRYGNGDVRSETYSFSTLPSNDFSAFYTTDIHIAESSSDEFSIRDRSYNLDRTLSAAFEKNDDISLILSGGDQASNGLRSEYVGLVASLYFTKIPFATTIGNHDRKAPTYRYFKNVPNENDKYITSSYIGSDYWFVKGDVLFFMLDTNNTSAEDHRNLIKRAVALNPDVKWRVAVFHHDLYGGRIESRESDNRLMRKILTPIFDEFKLDLVLMGHSHYYTISNVIFDDKTVLETAELDEVTNPEGTVYMVSGSINNPRADNDGVVPPLGENAGKSYLTMEKIYNIIDFTENSISIHSYTVESGEEFESFTITKTTKNGGHPDSKPGFMDVVLRYISVIAGFFNNIGRTLDYLQTYIFG